MDKNRWIKHPDILTRRRKKAHLGTGNSKDIKEWEIYSLEKNEHLSFFVYYDLGIYVMTENCSALHFAPWHYLYSYS